MKKIKLSLLILFLIYSIHGISQVESLEKSSLTYKIQVALLIDISGSMDGLISQTQGQLWKMANYLSQLEKNGKIPIVELALISYGGLEFEKQTAINLESPLVSDLDRLAERLFQLSARGSQEHCAEALQLAADSLDWSENEEDMKVIIIAGNEAFDQGNLSIEEVCNVLEKKNILLNTIFCGSYKSGVELHWQKAALLTGGLYANINQHLANEQMDTPFDSKIAQLYHQFKATLIPYGQETEERTRRMEYQDQSVKKMGNIFYRDRVMFLINNPSDPNNPDLIELFEENPDTLNKVQPQLLPSFYQKMSLENLRKTIIQNQYKRGVLKQAIELYNSKIDDYLKVSLGAGFNENSLETVLLQILREQAQINSFF